MLFGNLPNAGDSNNWDLNVKYMEISGIESIQFASWNDEVNQMDYISLATVRQVRKLCEYIYANVYLLLAHTMLFQSKFRLQELLGLT